MDYVVDFLFAGAGILPMFFFFAGEPALAAMASLVLMLAGALCGIGDPHAPHRTAAATRTSRPTPSRLSTSDPSRRG